MERGWSERSGEECWEGRGRVGGRRVEEGGGRVKGCGGRVGRSGGAQDFTVRFSTFLMTVAIGSRSRGLSWDHLI